MPVACPISVAVPVYIVPDKFELEKVSFVEAEASIPERSANSSMTLSCKSYLVKEPFTAALKATKAKLVCILLSSKDDAC